MCHYERIIKHININKNMTVKCNYYDRIRKHLKTDLHLSYVKLIIFDQGKSKKNHTFL